MSIGRLGFDLFSLGPLWSMHQSMAQYPDVDLFQETFSLSSVPGFQVHVIGQGLTDKAPTIFNVPSNQLYQAPGLTGTFATANVDGALILSNNAFYLNSVSMNVSGLLQLGGGGRSTPPVLPHPENGAVIVGPLDNLTINGTWGDLVGTTLTRGNYPIAGEFFYSGNDIVQNAANLSIGTDVGFLNNGHNALRSLASNSGTFTMNFMSLAVPNSFSNTGTVKLNGANFTTQDFANSGTVEIGRLHAQHDRGWIGHRHVQQCGCWRNSRARHLQNSRRAPILRSGYHDEQRRHYSGRSKIGHPVLFRQQLQRRLAAAVHQ